MGSLTRSRLHHTEPHSTNCNYATICKNAHWDLRAASTSSSLTCEERDQRVSWILHIRLRECLGWENIQTVDVFMYDIFSATMVAILVQLPEDL